MLTNLIISQLENNKNGFNVFINSELFESVANSITYHFVQKNKTIHYGEDYIVIHVNSNGDMNQLFDISDIAEYYNYKVYAEYGDDILSYSGIICPAGVVDLEFVNNLRYIAKSSHINGDLTLADLMRKFDNIDSRKDSFTVKKDDQYYQYVQNENMDSIEEMFERGSSIDNNKIAYDFLYEHKKGKIEGIDLINFQIKYNKETTVVK